MTDVGSASVVDQAHACLMASDVDVKLALTRQTAQQWREGMYSLESSSIVEAIEMAGHPERPVLVRPRDLPRRRLNSSDGLAAMWHAIAHIEFNAINLAWDAVYRFRHMPRQFYDDWVRIADEEAYHFTLIREHLRALGHDYGDFSAHNGLWEMARQTAHDVLVRMALVPRVLEARGLDVTPGIARRLAAAGDDRAEDILAVIFRDEIGHVESGTRWFNYCCAERGLDPETTFFGLLDQYMKGELRGPIQRAARLQAGFTESELGRLILYQQDHTT